MNDENEGVRQLNICNSCRYCEGYCAVFPAIERRSDLTGADVLHLANLCHDCRACLYACMYAPPHEFAINLPVMLAEARLETYDTFVPAPEAFGGDRMTRNLSAVASFTVIASAVLAIVAATRGWGILGARRTQSPYAVMPYILIVALALAPVVVGVTTVTIACTRYWRSIGGHTRQLLNISAACRALW